MLKIICISQILLKPRENKCHYSYYSMFLWISIFNFLSLLHSLVNLPPVCSPWGHYSWDTTERLHFHFSPSCIGEGNGNPLQCSCLENPRDGEAWWAAVYRVAQIRTRLKWLSSSSSCCHVYLFHRKFTIIFCYTCPT